MARHCLTSRRGAEGLASFASATQQHVASAAQINVDRTQRGKLTGYGS
jgi:hypothetical protein